MRRVKTKKSKNDIAKFWTFSCFGLDKYLLFFKSYLWDAFLSADLIRDMSILLCLNKISFSYVLFCLGFPVWLFSFVI